MFEKIRKHPPLELKSGFCKWSRFWPGHGEGEDPTRSSRAQRSVELPREKYLLEKM